MATGTSGKPVIRLQEPWTAGLEGPLRRISPAEVHGPRPPASLVTVSRTKRADAARVKVAVLTVSSSRQVPVATGVPKVTPSVLVAMEYAPARPLGPVERGW